ncbi:Flp pilus assembly protein TadB [Actinomyces bovis]|uniref:Flp pilus assembly protein TadB n=1 Tax=Actinomyces bovis TaxID=1658 RepID=A0ABY1VM25_9ACTO|nr:type II secretion system F family protein [Actinomyces bovis]SPT52731.1 Flp pilus assembly protein TadB [Actinomyces bovis]VEG54706.1 Flp pilus assembly protein TadB [Actinomyces israelii]
MRLGAICGAGVALGLLFLLTAWRASRPRLVDRVAPYMRFRRGSQAVVVQAPARTVSGALLGSLGAAGSFFESIGSSDASVRRRLRRSGSTLTVEEVRLQQVLWAAGGIVAVVALGLLARTFRPVNLAAVGVLAMVAAVAGAAARDWWLARQVERRHRAIEAELPDVVELLALVVGAGQGPVAAMERIVSLGRGALIDEFARALADVRAGTTLSAAMGSMAERVGAASVTRLADAVAAALERGTPLAEVLRAQAADSREASRRRLIEEGGRREIAQMVPVVFLILPITVVFALFPGLLVLRLGL